MRKILTTAGALLAGAAMTLAGGGSSLAAGTGVIHVPSDFVPALSDTRATGHYAVQGTGLHVWTEGATSTDKVAEYVATSTPLADAGEPSLSYTPNIPSTPPGFQLGVDLDNDGTFDGILVGEPAFYANRWWANNTLTAWMTTHPGVVPVPANDGYAHSAPLDTWRAAYPDANVVAFGFSLGSGVHGDGVINSLTFAGTTYTFAADVVLTDKEQCKKGGWATSTMPVFKNQGDCVSHFATQK